MSKLIDISLDQWDASGSPAQQAAALQALEDGHVLLLPRLGFVLYPEEHGLLNGAAGSASGAKNISWDPARGVRGQGDACDAALLAALMQRYARQTRSLLAGLLPSYQAHLQQGKGSFRPVEIAGRVTSWRKDDTRLHIDSFPSSPTQGRRILRVFTNIHPRDAPRVWKLGPPFEQVAQHFLPVAQRPQPVLATLLQWLRITKSRRTAYDHYMLQLHDAMKADLAYQAQVEQHTHAFAPGQTWIIFSDAVSHAALRGQHALEQTWLLPVRAMAAPDKSPLAILERQLQRPLA
ncbi:MULTISPECIES: Kdo hydroxylase family protein [unclassified Janthinobacterium]|uniref:Kdo hydroxylase family protein n=1 Tax=unclassified Janthinobacterium TaxID=2610881 RepID=UPI0025B5B7D7|nr:MULTISPECIES: Kdo hydroxylase family protein [unclassified Janthinobacterium]MDN2673499.1 Kdo hydroxylase family protein [Janthinobacterium sp. SUN026]MDN2717187.1 Kdo hydroxylase family protein [Janthinobacterium sp. SUN120]